MIRIAGLVIDHPRSSLPDVGISLDGGSCPRKILVSSIKSVQSFILSPSYCLDHFLSAKCIAALKSNVESTDNFLDDPNFSPWLPLYLNPENHRQAASDMLRVSCTKLFGERLARHRALLEKCSKQSHSVVGAVRDLSTVSKLIAEKKQSQTRSVRFLDCPVSGVDDQAGTGDESAPEPSKVTSAAGKRLFDINFLASDNRHACQGSSKTNNRKPRV